MDSIEAAVIGGGVVGLAVGRALAMQGTQTLVFERHARPGQETTSRNSGVIHSGIYYPAGRLKATLCVQGRDSSSCWASSHPGRQPHSRSPNVSRA